VKTYAKVKSILRSSLLFVAFPLVLSVGGCSSLNRPTADQKPSSGKGVTEKTDSAGQGQRGSAQLWSQNCSRCHNLRDPSSYSETQWEVIMLHMRVRANLTAQEHKAILQFLQASK
jgi:hypothetical protein